MLTVLAPVARSGPLFEECRNYQKATERWGACPYLRKTHPSRLPACHVLCAYFNQYSTLIRLAYSDAHVNSKLSSCVFCFEQTRNFHVQPEAPVALSNWRSCMHKGSFQFAVFETGGAHAGLHILRGRQILITLTKKEGGSSPGVDSTKYIPNTWNAFRIDPKQWNTDYVLLQTGDTL